MDQGVNEFVGKESMRAFVAAVMTERFGQHVRLPPVRLLILLEVRGFAKEAGIVFFHLFAGADNDRAEAVWMGCVETHLVAYPLRPLAASMCALPPDVDSKCVAAICPEHCGFVPERVAIGVVL